MICVGQLCVCKSLAWILGLRVVGLCTLDRSDSHDDHRSSSMFVRTGQKQMAANRPSSPVKLGIGVYIGTAQYVCTPDRKEEALQPLYVTFPLGVYVRVLSTCCLVGRKPSTFAQLILTYPEACASEAGHYRIIMMVCSGDVKQ